MIRIVKILIEMIAWLAIAASPTLLFGAVGFLIYIKSNSVTLPIIIASIGFIVGVTMATVISVKYGAMEWISQIRRIS